MAKAELGRLKGTPKRYSKPEWVDAERKFRHRRDYRFVVLAIGHAVAARSKRTPVWAVKECLRLYDLCEKSSSIVIQRAGRPTKRDDGWLDEMARLLWNEEAKSMRHAATLASKRNKDSQTVKRLSRKFSDECLFWDGNLPFNPRMERLLMKRQPWRRKLIAR